MVWCRWRLARRAWVAVPNPMRRDPPKNQCQPTGDSNSTPRDWEKRGSDNSADGMFTHACVAKFGGGFKDLLTGAPACRATPTLGRAHNPALLPVPIPVETGALGATNEDMTVLDFKRPTVGLMLFTAAAPPPTPSSCSTTPARPSAPPSPPRPAAPPSANSGARGALHGRRTEPATLSAAHRRPASSPATRSTCI